MIIDLVFLRAVLNSNEESEGDCMLIINKSTINYLYISQLCLFCAVLTSSHLLFIEDL